VEVDAPKRGPGQELMRYRAEVVSIEGFVQQIACCYLRHGYWFYVTGDIPAHKDAQAVDEKLISKYGIGVSESTRARRKRLGRANLQYLRFRSRFVILATKGQHELFCLEAKSIHDIRHIPLQFHGYSISYRQGGRTRGGEIDQNWHSHVEIERRRYLEIKALLLETATHRSADNLALAFYRLPFEPYAPVRRQMLNLLRAVNRARRKAGFAPVPVEVLPLRRRIVRPFGPESSAREQSGVMAQDAVHSDNGDAVSECFVHVNGNNGNDLLPAFADLRDEGPEVVA
jgi:hypothetical protein